MHSAAPTRLALLATISDLHRLPVAYDLACLRALVASLAPDLLCAEVTREMWEGGDLTGAALEVREALAPTVAATYTVLVPVAPSNDRFDDFAPDSGWRGRLVGDLDRALRWGQRRAGSPEAVNGPLFEAFCHPLCLLTELSWSAEQRSAWEQQNRAIAANIIAAVRRDPGRRVLVAVQCQRIHKLVPLLKRQLNDVQLVKYWEL
jgi:hypothetical protein